MATNIETSASYGTVERFLRMKELCALTGLSRSHIHRMRNKGTFPQPIALSSRCKVWKQSVIIAWQADLGTA